LGYIRLVSHIYNGKTSSLIKELDLFIAHTRVMNPANRIDAISFKLLFMAWLRKRCIIDFINKKIDACLSEFHTIVQEINENKWLPQDYATVKTLLAKEKTEKLEVLSKGGEDSLKWARAEARQIKVLDKKIKEAPNYKIGNWLRKAQKQVWKTLHSILNTVNGSGSMESEITAKSLLSEVKEPEDLFAKELSLNVRFWKAVEEIGIQMKYLRNIMDFVEKSELPEDTVPLIFVHRRKHSDEALRVRADALLIKVSQELPELLKDCLNQI
jgi:hypothetical protein